MNSLKELTKSSQESIARDLDLIRFIRAKSMHGFGLSLQFDEDTLKLSGELAYTRPFKEIKPAPFGRDKNSWWSIEGITAKEKLAIKLLKRNSPKKN